MLKNRSLFSRKNALGLLFASLLLLNSCEKGRQWRSYHLVCFDTVCQIRIYCSYKEGREAETQIQALFEDIDHTFSPYSKSFENPEAVALFRKANEVHLASKGCFDVTVGPLESLWGFRSGNYRVPSPAEIKEALSFVGMDRISYKDGRLVVPTGMSLDWGGIAKGYAVDQAVLLLRSFEINNGFINAGGDLRCWGRNPESQAWKVGIKHPREPGFLGVLRLSDGAAATTGDYQRYFEEKGIRYHHVFDPATGYPAEGNQSVTVIGPETLFCDALSTALFVSTHPESIMAAFPDYGAVIIDSGGRLSFMGKKVSFSKH